MRNTQRKTWFASILRWMVIILAILSGKIAGRSERQESRSVSRLDQGNVLENEKIQERVQTYPSSNPFNTQPVSSIPAHDEEEFLEKCYQIASEGYVEEFVSKVLRDYSDQPKKLLLIFEKLIAAYPKNLNLYIQYFIRGAGYLDFSAFMGLINRANLSLQEKLIIFSSIDKEISTPEIRQEIKSLEAEIQKSQQKAPASDWTLFYAFLTVAVMTTLLRWLGMYSARQSSKNTRSSARPEALQSRKSGRKKRPTQTEEATSVQRIATLEREQRLQTQKEKAAFVQRIAALEHEAHILEKKTELLKKIEYFLQTYSGYIVKSEALELTDDVKKIVKNFVLFSDFSEISEIKITLKNDQDNNEDWVNSRAVEFEKISAKLLEKKGLVDRYFELDKKFEDFNKEYQSSINRYAQWQNEEGNSRALKYREIIKKNQRCVDEKKSLDLAFCGKIANESLLDINKVNALSREIKQLADSIEAEKLIGEIEVFLAEPELERYKKQKKVNALVADLEELKIRIDTKGKNIKNLTEEYHKQREIYAKQRKEFLVKDPVVHQPEGTPLTTKDMHEKLNSTTEKSSLPQAQKENSAMQQDPHFSADQSASIFIPNVKKWEENEENLKQMALKNASTLQLALTPEQEAFQKIYSNIQSTILDRKHNRYNSQNCIDNILYFLRCYYHCTRLAVVMINENQQAPKRRHILVHLMKFHPMEEIKQWGNELDAIQRYAEHVIKQYALVFRNPQALPSRSDFEKQFLDFHRNAYETRRSLHHFKLGNPSEQDLGAIDDIESSKAVACQIIHALTFIKYILKKDAHDYSELEHPYPPDRVDALKQLLAFLGEQFSYLRDFYRGSFEVWKTTAEPIIGRLIHKLIAFRAEVYHEVAEPQAQDVLRLGWEIQDIKVEAAFVVGLRRIPVWDVDIASQNKILNEIQQQQQITFSSRK